MRLRLQRHHVLIPNPATECFQRLYAVRRLSGVENLLLGKIIKKCWKGSYGKSADNSADTCMASTPCTLSGEMGTMQNVTFHKRKGSQSLDHVKFHNFMRNTTKEKPPTMAHIRSMAFTLFRLSDHHHSTFLELKPCCSPAPLITSACTSPA